MTMMLAPLASFGMEVILVRRVVADAGAFGTIWAQALATICLSSVPLSIFVTAAFGIVLPGLVSSFAVFAVSISDLLFGRWLDCGSRAYLAHDQSSIAAWIPSCASFARLLGLLVLLFSGHEVSITDWALVYCLGAVLPAVLVVAMCTSRFGRPMLRLRGWGSALKQGMVFSLDQTAERGRVDADKVILANLRGTDAAGWYALGFRFVSLAAIPISALLYVTYNRFFAEGLRGPGAVLRYTLGRLPIPLLLVTLLSVAIAVASPLVAILFGTEYEQSGQVLRYLSVLLPLLLVRQMFANGLAGAGFERYRLAGGVGAFAMNLSVNFLLIPKLGWIAAVFAALASELVLAIFYVAVLISFRKRSVIR